MAYANNALVCVAWALLYRYADFVTLLGGTELHLGWVVGVGWIGSVLMRFGVGLRIDQVGPRPIWLGSLLLFSAACLGHLGVTRCDGPAIYALRIALCTGTAGIFGASTMFVAGRASGPRMAELLGMLGTSGFLGMMLGTHLGDWMCGSSPSQDGAVRMFLGAALLGLGAVPFAWAATRKLRPPVPQRSLPVAWLVGRYHPGMLLVVSVATGAALTLPATFLRTYAAELQIPRIGLFFTVAALTAVTTRVVTRRLLERVGLPRMILLGVGTMALAQVLFLLVRAEWQLILPGLVHGVAQAILYPTITAAGTSAFPERYRGLGTMVMLATLDVGQLIGAPAAGVILHGSEALGFASYPTMFVVMAAALLAAAGSYAMSLRRGAEGRVARAPCPCFARSTGETPVPPRVSIEVRRPTTAPQAAGSSRSTAAARR